MKGVNWQGLNLKQKLNNHLMRPILGKSVQYIGAQRCGSKARKLARGWWSVEYIRTRWVAPWGTPNESQSKQFWKRIWGLMVVLSSQVSQGMMRMSCIWWEQLPLPKSRSDQKRGQERKQGALQSTNQPTNHQLTKHIHRQIDPTERRAAADAINKIICFNRL